MRSRNSWFNANIYRNALRRFWPVGAGYALVWLYRLIQFSPRQNENIYGTMQYHLLRMTLASGISLCAVGAVILVMAMFAWLFFTRRAAFAAALPVRREALFLSNLAAGFTLLEAAHAAAIILALLMGSYTGLEFAGAAQWFLIVTLLSVLFLGLASLCAVLTGNIAALPGLYAVALYAAVALESSLRWISQYLVFGITNQGWRFTALSPIYYFGWSADNHFRMTWVPDPYTGAGTFLYGGFSAWGLLCTYAAAGAVFLLMALWLLRRRKMECAGDVMAFRGLSGVFCLGAALACTLTAGLVTLRAVFAYDGYSSIGGDLPHVMILLLVMLLGGFAGWFGARMLMRKSFRVFDGGWVGFGAFALAAALVLLSVEFDLTGTERRVPKAERVGSVEIYDMSSSYNYARLTESENIAAAITLHEHIIENKALFEADQTGGYAGGGMLELWYYDRDGKAIEHRVYPAPAGGMAWASNGDAYYTYASYGDAWYSTYGDAYASWGDAYARDVWGSTNPVLPELEALLNCGEAVAARLYPQTIPASAVSMDYGYVYWNNDTGESGSLDLSAAESWELYHDCFLPDAEDSSLGRVRLRPAEFNEQWGGTVYVGFTFREWNGGENRWDGIGMGIPADAVRTNAWLSARGVAIHDIEPGVAEAEPAAATVYELPPLEGLSALLEKVYLEYDPSAAGAMTSVRWARSLLEWYSASALDGDAARDAAEIFARRYVVTSSFQGGLAKLRTAGQQLVSGELGLVRDYTPGTWSGQDVDSLFDAIQAGLDAV